MNQVVDREKLAIFAEEALVVDAQVFLHNLMEEKGVSRAELARRMGVSRARVTQMFSDECTNLTIRLLARAAHALGERIELDCDHFRSRRLTNRRAEVKASPDVHWFEEYEKTDDQNLPLCESGDDRILMFASLSRERLAA